MRRRFEKTHRAVTEGVKFSHDELISLPSTLPLLRTLQKELSQPTMGKNSRMQLIVDKQPEGTRSPNLADAVVMAYWPVDAHASRFELRLGVMAINICDLPLITDVRYWMNSRRLLLAESISPFDPELTWSAGCPA